VKDAKKVQAIARGMRPADRDAQQKTQVGNFSALPFDAAEMTGTVIVQ
jgi:hypothetical protein